MSTPKARNIYATPGLSHFRSELDNLKIIGVEEHSFFPHLINSFPNDGACAHPKAMLEVLRERSAESQKIHRLIDLGEGRVEVMDKFGVSMQILGFTGGLNSTHLEPEAGLTLSQQINNGHYEAVKANPTRLAALAELPVHAPELAIQELRRSVVQLGFVGAMFSGSIASTGEFLDHPKYDSLLSEFESLDVPLFLHPGLTPKSVMDCYYTIPGSPKLSVLLGGMGWGWHNEVAIHIIRLAISGTLERHPKLKIVIGHQGEMLPMMIQRLDGVFDREIFGYKRTVGEMLRGQVWIAISGMFTLPPTQAAIHTWGVDRVLYANDYPHVQPEGSPRFLQALGDIIAPSDMRKICQTNAEKLFKIAATHQVDFFGRESVFLP